MDKWATPTDAAKAAGLNPEYVRQLARKGRIQCQRYGRALMVNLASLAEHTKQVKQWRKARKKGGIKRTTKATDL